MTTTTIHIVKGKEYIVNHSRKGVFSFRVTAVEPDWVTGVITAGHASAGLAYKEKEEGEEITIRKSFCTFSELVPGEIRIGAK